MKLFYTIMLLAHQFHLALALKAPVPNKKHIELLRGDVARWERAVEDAEIRARFG
jgi:hypothetical protein